MGREYNLNVNVFVRSIIKCSFEFVQEKIASNNVNAITMHSAITSPDTVNVQPALLVRSASTRVRAISSV